MKNMSLLLSWRRLQPLIGSVRRLVQTESSCISTDEEDSLARQKISRVVNVAIIGAPNAGKSTLINHIVDRKVCAASKKVHTTRHLARAFAVVGDTQIVFLDTPGILTENEKKKYSLPNSMEESYQKSLRIANVIGILHDVTSMKGKESLHWSVSRILQQVHNLPCFLILNKIDLLKEKKALLSVIRILTNGMIGGRPIPGPPVKPPKEPHRPRGYSHFSDVFMVSALRGDGVSDIRDYLVSNAQPAKTQYNPTKWTDQTDENLIEETVRAKLMDFLPQEIPYKLIADLEYYEDMVDRIVISVVVSCQTARIARLVAGSGGGRLNQIQTCAREDLAHMFKKPVTLQIRLNTLEKE